MSNMGNQQCTQARENCFVAPKKNLTKVCVTGANGYIASHLVQQLLDSGVYEVVGTVRTLTESRTAHLKAMDGAKTRLTILEADLSEEKGYRKAFEDCVCIFHCASPFYSGSSDKEYSEESMCTPALEGTNLIMKLADEEKSVTHVILTSSTASVYCRAGKEDGHCFTEDDWSNVEDLRKNKDWYALSKTVAEQSAWNYCRENAWNLASEDISARQKKLVVMNPTLVWGPMLSPHLNESCGVVLSFCNGSKDKYPYGGKTVVDVRDVAKAHIAGFENPKANGRNVLISLWVSWKDICQHLQNVVPKTQVPSRIQIRGADDPEPAVPYNCRFDSTKAENLIGGYIGWKQSVTETVTSLITQRRLSGDEKKEI